MFFPFLANGSEDSKPNVVLILSDDQGWRDYGFMGNDAVSTPHLDQLAARSLVFERGHVPAPLCRPSLASMVTGLYPRITGWWPTMSIQKTAPLRIFRCGSGFIGTRV